MEKSCRMTTPSHEGDSVTIKDGSWEELGAMAKVVRHAVFIQEQNIPRELENDGRDVDCHHVVALKHDRLIPVGTARLLPDGHIGRMAVIATERQCGIGRKLLKRLLDVAQHIKRYDHVVLESQLHAKGFYEKLGFTINHERGIFVVAGIEHVEMYCRFSNS